MDKQVIILGQARSGSTLVQRVINSINGAYIAGENKDFWGHIFEAWRSWNYIPIWETKIAQAKGCEPFSYTKEGDEYKPCWFNDAYHTDRKRILGDFRRLFKSIYWNRVSGFKEIRFPMNPQDFKEYIDFLHLMFPDLYLIRVVRNIDDVVKSGWHKPKDRSTLKKQERLLRNESRGFLVDYDNPNWKGLFEYLGEPLDEVTLNRILNKKL